MLNRLPTSYSALFPGFTRRPGRDAKRSRNLIWNQRFCEMQKLARIAYGRRLRRPVAAGIRGPHCNETGPLSVDNGRCTEPTANKSSSYMALGPDLTSEFEKLEGGEPKTHNLIRISNILVDWQGCFRKSRLDLAESAPNGLRPAHYSESQAQAPGGKAGRWSIPILLISIQPKDAVRKPA